jgi:hypothetical protein
MLSCLNLHSSKTRLILSKSRLIVSLTTVSCVVLNVTSPAQAGTISNVSRPVFQCMRANNSNSEGYILYPNDPKKPNNPLNSGTIQAYSKLNVYAGSVNLFITASHRL